MGKILEMLIKNNRRGLVTTVLNRKVSEVEIKILDVNGLVTTTDLNTKREKLNTKYLTSVI